MPLRKLRETTSIITHSTSDKLIDSNKWEKMSKITKKIEIEANLNTLKQTTN